MSRRRWPVSVLALIAMVALVGVTTLGTNLKSLYSTVAGSV